VDDGAGDSAFIGTWTSPTGRGTGLFHNGVAVAVVGGAAPTGAEDGAKFASFGQPLVSVAGVAFSARLVGARVNPRLLNSNTIWSNTRDGQIHPYLKRTDAPPDVDGGLIDSVVSFSLRDAELIALVNYTVGRGGVTASTRTALIASSPQRYEKLVRTGDTLNTTGSPRVVKISAFTPAPLSPGQDRTHADGLAVVQVVCNDQRRVDLACFSATDRRVLAGTDATAVYSTVGLPAAGSNSAVGLGAIKKHTGTITVKNDGVMLFGDPTATLTATVSEGASVGTNLKVGSTDDPIFNDQGAYAFCTLLTGVDLNAQNNRALIFGGASAPAIVARLADLAPDGTGERRFDVHYQKFLALGLPDGAGAGPLWLAQLSGSNVGARNNLGLFASDSAGVKGRLLRTQDSLDVFGTTKMVAAFTALGGGTFPIGGRRAYGTTGTVAVQVTFTDGSFALVRIEY
jgi:hypothetical protein